MTLRTGSRLSYYEILGPLGAGAMGEVFRARDTRLGRDVAVKVLPEHFAADPDRLKRFEREAHTLASLNHPNVAQIFAVDQVGDSCFLVLELVEGESLEERLKRGPLPLDEALDACRQIAEGLEAAHEAGVIHRDLKPANVRLTPDGKVKVLDFGLAKPANEMHDGSSTDSVLSTEAGRLLGTPTYMAPEQARGKPIDRRVDIWAFGCVLYECLTAQRAFAGETLTDVFAAVIERQPDWTKLPAATPPRVRELLQRCFAKDPRSRLRDVGEARVLLADPATWAERPRSGPEAAPAARRRVRISAFLAVAAGGVGAALALAFDRGPTAAPAPPVRRYELTGVHSTGRSLVAISPDGQWVAWREAGRDPPIRLRRRDSFEDRTIPDSMDGDSPFFAPDSRSLAFFVHGRGLLRVALEPGAAVQTITADAANGWGAWGPDGTIVFAGGLRDDAFWPGLMRVPAGGGRPEILTTVDAAQAEHWHRWPQFMPDGRRVVFSTAIGQGYRIECVDLATGERHPILDTGVNPRVLPTGHLAYGDAERHDLLVAPFDVQSLRLTGPAAVAVPGVASTFAGLTFAIADDGTLVYDPEVSESLLVAFDRNGKRTTLDTELGRWTQSRISPDGRRLLVRRIAAPNCSLWMVDLERGVKTRLALEGDPHEAIWSSDGASILFDVMSAAKTGVFRCMLDGGAPELLVPSAEHNLSCSSLSSDGRFLALTSAEKATTAPDIEILEIATGVRTSFLATKAAEYRPAFSPDGRFIAYVSDDTGRAEVYLRPFPGPGAAVRVSTEGGSWPVWSRDGRELFFAEDRKLFAAGVDTSSALHVGTPAPLFESAARSSLAWAFDVSPDAQRFFAAVSSHGADEVPVVRVVTNWFEEVRRLAPTEPGR